MRLSALLAGLLFAVTPGIAYADPGNEHAAQAPGQIKKNPGALPTTADPAPSSHSDGTTVTSGVATEPQPLSNADQNPGGANNGGDCGAYCSTRDGSPSLNGNGGGAAKGKPCAGCVGKADNKNPRGQRPNGSDHNNGYECDGNRGVARGNPAHTSCNTNDALPPLPPAAPPKPVEPNGSTNNVQSTPSEPNNASSSMPEAVKVKVRAASSAATRLQDRGNGFTMRVRTTESTPPAMYSKAELPFTGLNTITMLMAGTLLTLFGVWLRRYTRLIPPTNIP